MSKYNKKVLKKEGKTKMFFEKIKKWLERRAIESYIDIALTVRSNLGCSDNESCRGFELWRKREHQLIKKGINPSIHLGLMFCPDITYIGRTENGYTIADGPSIPWPSKLLPGEQPICWAEEYEKNCRGKSIKECRQLYPYTWKPIIS